MQRVDAMLLPGGRRRRAASEKAGEQQSVARSNEKSAFWLCQRRFGHVVDWQARFGVAHCGKNGRIVLVRSVLFV